MSDTSFPYLSYSHYLEHRTRPSMPPAQRAKIFSPFDALTGLHTALLQKEQKIVPPPEWNDYTARELDLRLQQLRQKLSCGQPVAASLVYYHAPDPDYPKGAFLKETGMICRLDTVQQLLQITDHAIPLASIKELDFSADT